MVDHMAAPGALLAPAVEDGHRLDTVGDGSFDVFVELPELVADGFNIIHKLREFQSKL